MKERSTGFAYTRGLMAALLFALVPAHAALFDDDEARKQITVERARIDDVLKQLGVINERLGKVEDQLKSGGLLDLQTQIEQLRQDMATLRGQIEVLNNNIDGVAKRQRDMYTDLDTRLHRLEQPATAGADSSTETVPGVSPPAADAENQAYEAAQEQRRIGNYQGAIAALQAYIKQYPQDSRVPRAQYWIGDSYYNLRDFKSAIANQQALIKTYPDSSSVPDAMLNIASAQIEFGDIKAAKKSLHNLIAKYPTSDAADKAKRRLATLGAKK
jgi:tol-pal system protein YbgF